jgi:hypothetical protein
MGSVNKNITPLKALLDKYEESEVREVLSLFFVPRTAMSKPF